MARQQRSQKPNARDIRRQDRDRKRQGQPVRWARPHLAVSATPDDSHLSPPQVAA